jgi:hypothetical protein
VGVTTWQVLHHVSARRRPAFASPMSCADTGGEDAIVRSSRTAMPRIRYQTALRSFIGFSTPDLRSADRASALGQAALIPVNPLIRINAAAAMAY